MLSLSVAILSLLNLESCSYFFDLFCPSRDDEPLDSKLLLLWKFYKLITLWAVSCMSRWEVLLFIFEEDFPLMDRIDGPFYIDLLSDFSLDLIFLSVFWWLFAEGDYVFFFFKRRELWPLAFFLTYLNLWVLISSWTPTVVGILEI